MAKFMEIKSINPKLKQSERAEDLKTSPSTLQRNRREINMFSHYRIPPSTNSNHTRKQKNSNTNHDDVKMTSNDLKTTSNDLKTTSDEPVKYNKSELKGGANIEINDKFLDGILHSNKL